MRFRVLREIDGMYSVICDDTSIILFNDVDSLDKWVMKQDRPIIQVFPNGKEKVICE